MKLVLMVLIFRGSIKSESCSVESSLCLPVYRLCCSVVMNTLTIDIASSIIKLAHETVNVMMGLVN
jgi:hypothetical protein